MSDNQTDSVSDAFTGRAPAKTATLVYILYLVGLLVPVIPFIIGVVLAYMHRERMAGWLASHSEYQIRTFWMGLLYSFVSALLMIVLIGWLVYLAVVVWLVVRCVKGLQAVAREEPVANPQGWGF